LKAGCRYLVAAAFLAAALTKIADPHAFADHLLLHSSLPYWLAIGIASVLPWLELTCGCCLALGIAVREAALIAALLLAVFLVYSLFQRDAAACGCFLFPEPLDAANRWPWTPLRNLVLLACAAWNVRR
jgi:uncharacterized membrane protein YphA (DoxX/SURF4 family)